MLELKCRKSLEQLNKFSTYNRTMLELKLVNLPTTLIHAKLIIVQCLN